MPHRAEVARARRRWMRQQGMFDPTRLVFIGGKTWTSTSTWCGCAVAVRARAADRLCAAGALESITFVAGLRERATIALFVLEGAMDGPMFLAYVRQCVVPILKRGEIVIIDNLPAHKLAGIREAIEAARFDAALPSTLR